ncbi:low temperature requirement protein A [Nocardioides sp.]|uniref:low temperature requirement protein A n=1 Tax=Nocardioides sp. TaxID=35761 RepID=UPI0037849E7B
MSEPVVDAERHASWLELFFDLVAVAGIGMLARLLVDDTSGGGIAVYIIAYTAIWMIWACFTLYSNVAGQGAHVVLILAAMFVLGVMTAAVPEIHGEHATAFAVAYVVGRFLAARPWQRAVVLTDLPIVQTGGGIVPWIVSFWCEGTTQYALWALGLAIDLWFLVSASTERLLASTQERLDRVRRSRRGAGRRGEQVPDTVEVVGADVPHLGERLGLFVLIVLGEGLVQIVDAASEAEWDRPLAVTGAGAFVLMFGLWAAAVRFGYAGVALLPDRALLPRLAWPAHLAATLALATVAAVLGLLVADPRAAVDDRVRSILLASYAGYALLCAGVLAATGHRRPAAWVAGPAVVAAGVVALGTGLAAEGTVWVLAAGVLVTLSARARGATAPAGA